MNGVGTVEVTHLALIVIAVALKDRNVLGYYFHGIVDNPGIAAILRNRR